MRLLSLAILTLAFPARAQPVVAQGPYVLLRSDGTELKLLEPPQLKGNVLVGRLWPDGTVVSFPARDLGGTPAGAPTPGPAVTPRPGVEMRPLGSMVKLNRSRAEAEKLLKGASGTAKAPKSEAEAAPEGADSAEAGSPVTRAPKHVDRNGRGESYWRARSAELRQRVVESEADLATAESALEEWDRGDVPGGSVERSSWAAELQERRSRVERVKSVLREAQRKMEGLREEARRADAFPGWLREQ